MFIEVIIVSKYQNTANQHFLEIVVTIDSVIPTEYKSSLVTTLLCTSVTIIPDDHKLHQQNCKIESSSNKKCIHITILG